MNENYTLGLFFFHTKAVGIFSKNKFSRQRNVLFFFLIFFLGIQTMIAQTVLLSPTINNGGFESGSAGWYGAQTGLNRGGWYMGTDTFYSGTRSAYISSDNGATNSYVGDQRRTQHLYREVVFPAGETNINLSFNWKGNGEGVWPQDYDNLKVFVSSTLPQAGTQNAEADKVGAACYNLQTNWQNVSIILPSAYAGTTKYLIFQWKHDDSVTNPPPAAIDNVTLTTQAPSPTISVLSSANGCPGSTLIITGTNFSGTTAVSIGNTAVTSYVVNSATQITATVGSGTTGTVKVTTPSGTATSAATFTVNPLPSPTTVSGGGTFCGSTTITASGGAGGIIYFQGTTSGGTSTATASSSQTVSASGTYYFRSQNASGCWGPQGSITVTKDADPSGLTAGSLTINSSQLTWSGAGTYIVEYGPPGFTPGNGAISGGGTIASSSAASPYNLTGLAAGTTYDVYVRRTNCPSAGSFGVNSPKVTFTTLSLCTPPSNPSALTFSSVSSTGLTLGLTPPATVPSGGYVVFRSTSATAPVLANGSAYTNGSTYSLPGNSYLVVSNGSSVNISQTGLTSNTRYYYYVFAQNTACSGQPFYSSGISANQVTCAGAPTGNIVSNITPSGVTISWTASVTGGGASAITYFVDVSTNAAFTAPIAGSPFANGVSLARTVTGLTAGTTYYYRIRANNGCESNLAGSFTTACRPSTSTANAPTAFITDVEFRGTLNDVLNNNSGQSGNGYQDFTGNPNKARQAAGEGMNVFVKSNDRDVNWKVWVDWNRDGTFDNTVYNKDTNPNGEVMFVSGTRAISTTFGFVIPATQPASDYVVRVRNYYCGASCGSTTYTPCSNFTGSDSGEAEDYIITVIDNCASSVTIVGAETCGSASLALVATGSSGTTKIRWYDVETGGSMVAETNVNASLQSTYDTQMLTATKTYWVTSFNGSCETLYRKPVVASIKPIPEFTFNLPSDNANFCGDDDRVILSTAGSMEEVMLINEDFEGGGLGVFTPSTGTGDNSTVANTGWKNKASIFTPEGSIWKPAISSGYGGDKFAYSTSDYSTRTVHSIMTSTGSFNTTGFTNLKLDFSAYYSFYGDTSAAAGGTVEGLYIEVQANGGAWVPANASYNQHQSLGYGTAFQDVSIILDAFVNVTSLKVRFRYNAYWGDGVAIDNIKLYGNRPLTTSFVWTAPDIGIYQADCSTPYTNGTPTASVCIKPSDVQMQTISDWNISAQQTVSNGCTTSATIAIHNQNKIWDTTASTKWSDTNWQPTNAVPAIDKCVLIKKPVNILTGGNFEAKNVKVVTGGSLTINKDSSLKIQDYIRNETGSATNVVVESDASLVQVNEGNTINTGSITAKREIKLSTGRQQFNYIGSPLEGQPLKTIYGGIGYVLYHNEANNFFYNSSGAYIKGRALAVQEPNETAVPGGTVTAIFTGYPTNGAFTYPIVNSNTDNTTKRGYNLVSNPYPSNIDLITLYAINGGAGGNLSPTFTFWDNNANNKTQQMGDTYPGQAYAQFIATTPPTEGTGIVATGDATIAEGTKTPTRYVKMGQGFMVQSKVASYQLQFNNTIRTTDKGTVSFFGKGTQDATAPVDRYWLNMISPNNIAAQMAVVYFDGGVNGFANDDALSLGGSDAVYSMVDSERVSINGRSSFGDADVVPLGTSQFMAGKYTFAVEKKEGVFAGSQHIYLKDKQTGILTDLSLGSYTFEAKAGESTGRFEIVYKPGSYLATTENSEDEIAVYRDASDFVIRSRAAKITAVEVYDAAGRLIYEMKPNSIKAVINSSAMLSGIYLLKINYKGISVVKKISK